MIARDTMMHPDKSRKIEVPVRISVLIFRDSGVNVSRMIVMKGTEANMI
jgi:hypothetical protein